MGGVRLNKADVIQEEADWRVGATAEMKGALAGHKGGEGDAVSSQLQRCAGWEKAVGDWGKHDPSATGRGPMCANPGVERHKHRKRP